MKFARRHCVGMIATACLIASLALDHGQVCGAPKQKAAANRRKAEPAAPTVVPFDPAMLERMFESSPSDDQAALESVEIEPQDERRLGDAAAASYLDQLRTRGVRTAVRGKDVQYIRQLIEVLHPYLRNEDRYRVVKIHVADSPEVDARSFPGGTVVVFRGLLDFAESEAALVGVLGHELSHFDRGHQLLPLKRAKLAQRTFNQRESSDLKRMFAAGGQMMRLFARPFRPEDEAQADADGAAWAYAAGYDPREMARLFLRMHEREQAKNRPDVMPGFLRTHPYSVDRHRAIMVQYEQLARDNPRDKLYIGRENLTRRIPRSEQEFDP
jgi:predicted Zn-dependent protease